MSTNFMSMSLRDQLLAAGLVSQKQVREAERQQQHQQREQSKHKRRPPVHAGQTAKSPGHGASAPPGANAAGGSAAGAKAAGATAAAANPARAPGARGGHGAGGAAPLSPSASAALRHASAQSAKVARDLALNKKQQEKAEQKARAAQIKQLIEQNRVPRGDSEERYNFLDGGRIKFIGVNAEIRRRLMAGELVIVRQDRIYDVVPAATAERIRERDARAVIAAAAAPAAAAADGPTVDDAYKDFVVPDDLMW
jgi:uncharacterized protein YaiL (DUF2058 family)